MAIQSFKVKIAPTVFGGSILKGSGADLVKAARCRLNAIDGAFVLDDLRSPPGDRLEAMTGDREDQHSIRINDQWRICLRWTDTGPEDVEIVEYH